MSSLQEYILKIGKSIPYYRIFKKAQILQDGICFVCQDCCFEFMICKDREAICVYARKRDSQQFEWKLLSAFADGSWSNEALQMYDGQIKVIEDYTAVVQITNTPSVDVYTNFST